METKDWLYLIGLILTFSVSLYSLIINIKNRRSAIREHLYKEQMSFFLKLSKEFTELLDKFYTVQRVGELNDDDEKIISQCIDNIFMLSEVHDFITPDEVITLLNKAYSIGDGLYTKAIKERLSQEEILILQNAWFDINDLTREIMGVDKLTDENKKLIKYDHLTD